MEQKKSSLFLRILAYYLQPGIAFCCVVLFFGVGYGKGEQEYCGLVLSALGLDYNCLGKKEYLYLSFVPDLEKKGPFIRSCLKHILNRYFAVILVR